MKTIKQIADELGVSKDKVKYQVGKLPGNYLVKSSNITYIKSEGVQCIKELLGKNYPGNSRLKDEEITYHYPPLINTLQDTITLLQQQLSIKDSQLEEKDKQILEKDKQISELMKLNDQQQQLQLQLQKQLAPPIEEIEKDDQVSKDHKDVIKDYEKKSFIKRFFRIY